MKRNLKTGDKIKFLKPYKNYKVGEITDLVKSRSYNTCVRMKGKDPEETAWFLPPEDYYTTELKVEPLERLPKWW